MAELNEKALIACQGYQKPRGKVVVKKQAEVSDQRTGLQTFRQKSKVKKQSKTLSTLGTHKERLGSEAQGTRRAGKIQ